MDLERPGVNLKMPRSVSSNAKKRSFKEAFDAATKEGKSKFMLGGKGYLTTKGKREDRFPVTTDKKKPADKKLNIFQKFTKKMRGTNADGSTRTQKEFEVFKKEIRIVEQMPHSFISVFDPDEEAGGCNNSNKTDNNKGQINENKQPQTVILDAQSDDSEGFEII